MFSPNRVVVEKLTSSDIQHLFCIYRLLAFGVTAGRRPRRCLWVFVEVLSSPLADQETSESSTFEVSSRQTLSADSSALNSSSLRAEQKVGLTRLSLSVLNIHQRLSHLTPLALNSLRFHQTNTFIFLHFPSSHLCLTPVSVTRVSDVRREQRCIKTSLKQRRGKINK